MAAEVLIDTSVWISFFRKKDPGLTEQLATLLKTGRAVYTGVIALELLNGAKGEKEIKTLYDVFETMRCASAKESTYLHAGDLGYRLARKGQTMSTIDLLIAQIAIENGLSLMTYDDHFATIAGHSPLLLFR